MLCVILERHVRCVWFIWEREERQQNANQYNTWHEGIQSVVAQYIWAYWFCLDCTSIYFLLVMIKYMHINN